MKCKIAFYSFHILNSEYQILFIRKIKQYLLRCNKYQRNNSYLDLYINFIIIVLIKINQYISKSYDTASKKKVCLNPCEINIKLCKRIINYKKNKCWIKLKSNNLTVIY